MAGMKVAGMPAPQQHISPTPDDEILRKNAASIQRKVIVADEGGSPKFKFTFRNLGPVKKGSLELGDLTIIAGPNNAGKTYVAYSLYGLLSSFQDTFNPDAQNKHGFAKLAHLLEKTSMLGWITGHHQKHGKIDLPIKFFTRRQKGWPTAVIKMDDLEKFMMQVKDVMCEEFSKEVPDFFSAHKAYFPKSKISLGIEFCITDIIPAEESWGHLPIESKMDRSKKQIALTIKTPENSGEKWTDFIKGYFIGYLVGAIIPDVFVLPAERLSIPIFYKELDFARNHVVDAIQRPGQTQSSTRALRRRAVSRYARPVKDHVDYVRDLIEIQKKNSTLAKNKLLFDSIKDIIGGYYRVEADDMIYFIPEQQRGNTNKIPLHLASEATRGLAGIYFYMRHVAKAGQLLVIDEPEAHLDTAAQIKMARLLARCVNAGIRVMITTHSDYILKEFNNLIMLSQNFPKKASFFKEYAGEYSSKDYLNRKSVHAYICENGGLSRCAINSRGMIMDMFDNTIDKINDISNALDTYLPEEE